jgi:hypothetical protein
VNKLAVGRRKTLVYQARQTDRSPGILRLTSGWHRGFPKARIDWVGWMRDWAQTTDQQ